MFRWDPDSVVERDGKVFAKYTNEHAAFYILTRAQLKRAVASGGFSREPYEGKYDMLCAAATDPYTSCGMQKVVCISELDRFLVHHMSDRYAGQMGLPLSAFQEQLVSLRDVRAGVLPAASLCAVETRIARGEFSKNLYEKPNPAVMQLIPQTARTVLSIGCGWGLTEERLVARGIKVTALPVDSVIGAAASRRGVEVVNGTMETGLAALGNRVFDCVLVTNLLHLSPSPRCLFEACARFVAPGGSFVVECPNFQRLGVLVNRLLGRRDFRKLRRFDEGGVSTMTPRAVASWARKVGLRRSGLAWFEAPWNSKLSERLPDRLAADGWVMRVTR
jgi:2-polyprenyl-3-methyl-5-hydroxy-6-metoxy-1,4-benzoquinol methylase